MLSNTFSTAKAVQFLPHLLCFKRFTRFCSVIGSWVGSYDADLQASPSFARPAEDVRLANITSNALHAFEECAFKVNSPPRPDDRPPPTQHGSPCTPAWTDGQAGTCTCLLHRTAPFRITSCAENLSSSPELNDLISVSNFRIQLMPVSPMSMLCGGHRFRAQTGRLPASVQRPCPRCRLRQTSGCGSHRCSTAVHPSLPD